MLAMTKVKSKNHENISTQKQHTVGRRESTIILFASASHPFGSHCLLRAVLATVLLRIFYGLLKHRSVLAPEEKRATQCVLLHKTCCCVFRSSALPAGVYVGAILLFRSLVLVRETVSPGRAAGRLSEK